MKYIIVLIFFGLSFSHSQNLTFKTDIEGNAYLKTNEELPFWIYTSNFGRLDSSSDFNTLFGQEISHAFNDNARVEVYGSLLYQNGFTDKIQIDQAYVRFTNKWLKLSAGAFHRDVAYNNLSSTNGSFLWSNNTRAIPGVVLEANTPITFIKNFSLDWVIGHYELIDDRVADGANIHYKRLGLNWNPSPTTSLSIGINHYVQWAGRSEEFGKFPQGFNDFIDIFFASNAGDEAPAGEQQNALGNHLGSYNLKFQKDFSTFNLEFYYEHPFEDGSGSAFKNAKDGLWGLYIEPKESIIQGVLYEFVNTKDQSGAEGISGRDNYFRNRGYQSGWTYEGRTVGLLFIYPTGNDDFGPNNRITAHHLGLFYKRQVFSGLIKGSYVENFGTYGNPFPNTIKSIYLYQEFNYKSFLGTLSLYSGADFSNLNSDRYAIGLGYTYSFNY